MLHTLSLGRLDQGTLGYAVEAWELPSPVKRRLAQYEDGMASVRALRESVFV